MIRQGAERLGWTLEELMEKPSWPCVRVKKRWPGRPKRCAMAKKIPFAQSKHKTDVVAYLTLVGWLIAYFAGIGLRPASI